jgi:glycosyltransferase involved in cell wall biosynthesis
MNSLLPLYNKIGIVALVPDHWDDIWMPRHQLLSRLGRYFNVVWVNPIDGWREEWFGKKQNGRKYSTGQKFPAGFHIHSPSKLCPMFYSPRALQKVTNRVRLDNAKRILKKKGCNKFILYMWRPDFGQSMNDATFDFKLYHIDDEYTFSETDLPVQSEELSVIKNVNQVFIHSPGLLEKKGHLNPKTNFIPNGVDFAGFSEAATIPNDLAKIPSPRIGYIGTIKKHINIPLLNELVSKHPTWSFVFVGPYKKNITKYQKEMDRLSMLPNAFFLGPKMVKDLPAYTQHMDVLTLPYSVNDYTKFIYPLKLHESLATGKPVVASPIRTLLDFNNILSIANSPDEWSNAIKNAMSPGEKSEKKIQNRQHIAKQFDWENIALRLALEIYGLVKNKNNHYLRARKSSSHL